MKFFILLLIPVFLALAEDGDVKLVDDSATAPDTINECLDPNEHFVCGFGEVDELFGTDNFESKCVWR